MDQIAAAAAWLAACTEAAHNIAALRPNAVRDAVTLVWDMPNWGHTPVLLSTYRRGRQIVYEAIANLQRRREVVSAAAHVESVREDLSRLIRRALALSRL